ncbi:iron-sulfur cluster assembly scaffold protein [Dendrosporobacter sp. 1207_IL3150]|uniref:iron-sulfur cluster assembly scaffold protein n=1 Tax=Dendrosporobacter sp. 1207_IL3150 TaxID=3084054 RepID=UPI002FD9690C
MYSQKVIEHFTSPRNVGRMQDADGIGNIGEPDCGDNCQVFIKVRDERIMDVSFLIFGCAAAIASGSATTVIAKGKTIEEALKITDQDILNELDGLPVLKQHCSNLGAAALHAAVSDYLVKQGRSIGDYV